MSNVLSHRSYRARVEFDAEDGLFFGRIAGIRDGVSFHADSVPALVQAFQEAVDDYVETCAITNNSHQFGTNDVRER